MNIINEGYNALTTPEEKREIRMIGLIVMSWAILSGNFITHRVIDRAKTYVQVINQKARS